MKNEELNVNETKSELENLIGKIDAELENIKSLLELLMKKKYLNF